MSKFRKKQGKTDVGISTASLPDIVFMLLFFFMVVTVIKENEPLVEVELPEATEISKLVRPQFREHIYVGKPIDKREGSAPRVQINDRFVAVSQVRDYLKPLPDHITVALEVDKGVTMGVVTDVKTEIRKSEHLKLQYVTRQGDGEMLR